VKENKIEKEHQCEAALRKLEQQRPLTSLGSPHNLRGYKSDSGTIMPGGSLSAPFGFVGT
jgi:hypothetical protein